MGKILKEGLTFDDVLLVPQASEVVPANVDLTTKLTPNLKLRLQLQKSSKKRTIQLKAGKFLKMLLLKLKTTCMLYRLKIQPISL